MQDFKFPVDTEKKDMLLDVKGKLNNKEDEEKTGDYGGVEINNY